MPVASGYLLYYVRYRDPQQGGVNLAIKQGSLKNIHRGNASELKVARYQHESHASSSSKRCPFASDSQTNSPSLLVKLVIESMI